jgi:hypothetical protein
MKPVYLILLTLLSFIFGYVITDAVLADEPAPIEKYPYVDQRISQYCMDFVNQQTLSTMYKYDEIIKSQCAAGMLIEFKNKDGSVSYLECKELEGL